LRRPFDNPPGQLAKSFDMPSASIEFGYLPMTLDFKVGPITVFTLPDLANSIDVVTDDPFVEADWIYPGPQQQHMMGTGIRELPYSGRVFILAQDP
jgi:hypothetical protein